MAWWRGFLGASLVLIVVEDFRFGGGFVEAPKAAAASRSPASSWSQTLRSPVSASYRFDFFTKKPST